jgi:hypothetical protein
MVRREDIDRVIGYEHPDDPVELALRADLSRGAQRPARDISAAGASDQIRHGLLADAFGVAQWALASLPASRFRLSGSR